MSEDSRQNSPSVSPIVVGLGLLGAVIGGVFGFWIRGLLNEREVIGYANIPDQLLKVLIWAAMGVALGAAVGSVLGWAINHCCPARSATDPARK
jgi:hypothetical protein